MGNRSLLFFCRVLVLGFMVSSFPYCTAAGLPQSVSEGGLGSYPVSEQSSPLNCCPEEHAGSVYTLTEPPIQSDEVREYQEALSIIGCYDGPLNGIYDGSTEMAVREFQDMRSLKTDGVLGPKTIHELVHIFESKSAAASNPPPSANVEIVIDADKKTLMVLDGNKVLKKYSVAVGKGETPTPIGEFRVKRKALNWGTGFGTRWIGLDVPWGIYGIHGTNKPWSIGSRASHGCIRMFNRDVEDLYPLVKPGTVVRITGQIYHPLYEEREKVFRGCKGSAVMLIQRGLIAEGYLEGKPDGIFGYGTEQALKKLQRERGFEVTGQVDIDIWPVLGL